MRPATLTSNPDKSSLGTNEHQAEMRWAVAIAPSRSVMSALVVVLVVLIPAMQVGRAQQPPSQLGGTYSDLDARRRQLVDDWVARFVKTTGQQVEAGPFYDDIISVSAKTTFDAVTHALSATALTDQSGAPLGDALALVDQVEAVRGEVAGAPGDHQFRMYVQLVAGAVDRLERSQQFKRGTDNTVYHRGYPINYRAQGGVPSIQISVALDLRHADVDVDYRDSSFPVGLFSGHLTTANSDVRAGNNFDLHSARWTGFQNWWRGFLGVRQELVPEALSQLTSLVLPKMPRAGKANVEVMANDFLTAWLIEGDIVTAMGYVSERSHACLARDSNEPSTFDYGLAPFQLMTSLKAARDSLPTRTSLDGLVVGTPVEKPGLRLVNQPHHARFMVYRVTGEVASSLDCVSQLTLAASSKALPVLGMHFATTFYIDGRRDTAVALLWARENGYWKIVSWKVGADDAKTQPSTPPEDTKVVRINADSTLVQAARGFLESWLIRKDYDAAFAYLSPRSYACYNLETRAGEASSSPEDAGRKLRASLEASGERLGTSRSLEALLAPAEPVHPAVRVMNHPYSRVFSVTSPPNAMADESECAARISGSRVSGGTPLEYGSGFGLNMRFKTLSGDTPVLRLLWRRENRDWRVTSYTVELP